MILAAVVLLPAPTPVAAAIPTCQASSPVTLTYTVTVCLDTPLAGDTLTGTTSVSASFSVIGTSPGVQRATFTLDGGPLLTDYTAPYTFVLDSARWGDGPHTLAVSLLMRDTFASLPATVGVTFTNGQVSPPPNLNIFTPYTPPSPPPGTPLVVAATGDGASGESAEASTVNLISSWNPNLFLYLGDVYENGQAMEFNNWYGAPSAAGTFGQFRAHTNPTPGNHEYQKDATAAAYFYYWDNIAHAYSYTSGGWHFISLDSNSQYGGLGTASAQYLWLQADLAANTSACTVVYYHHPLFDVGPEGKATALAPIWSLLAANHVTLVLNGHDHDYQRFEPLDGTGAASPTGVTEIVVGAGGHGHQSAVPLAPDAAHLVASDFSHFGAVKLNLYPSSAAFQFVSTGGQVLDSGLVPCRNGGADSTPPSTPTSFTAAAGGLTQINLAWHASTDNVGVAGYDIFRDGSLTPLATLEPGLLHYADTAVAPSSTHSYTVVAFDAAGNRSSPAGPRSATTPNGTATITLNPVADAYVDSLSPSTNYGTSVSLRVGTSLTTTDRSYLRFDLSGVAGTVQSASLKLYANSTQSVGYSVYGVPDTTWGESTINWSNAPPFGSVSGGASGPITSGTWTSADATSLAAPAVGGLLSLGLSTTGAQTNLASLESANPPQLVLSVGPRASGATYVALSPARLLDSRFGNGLSGPFSVGVPRTFAVSGRGGVPSNAVAVTGNLTVTGQTAAGYVFLGPAPVANPASSTLNFPLADSRANGVTVALGSGGTLSATYLATPGATTQLIFDVTGYFVR